MKTKRVLCGIRERRGEYVVFTSPCSGHWSVTAYLHDLVGLQPLHTCQYTTAQARMLYKRYRKGSFVEVKYTK